MKDSWELNLAVISDLHCHEESFSPQESWLLAGARRKPSGGHPIQALIDLIKRSSMSSDIVVCPGDLANKISSAGMMQAWSHLQEIQRELKAELLLPTIGNHDVDSKKLHDSDPFFIPKNLQEGFPLILEDEVAAFWHKGFYFSRNASGCEFVVLNTVISHMSEEAAVRGTFGQEQIQELAKSLQARQKLPDPSYRVAIMHHHPLLHSSGRFNSTDVLEFGDQILEMLRDHGFELIIHGHRHDPRVTRYASGLSDVFVFAAGSFSAILKELSTWTRNLFHVIKLRRDGVDNRLFGEIRSWEFNKGAGWRESSNRSAALPHVVRFCSPRPVISVREVLECAERAEGKILQNAELERSFPLMRYLMPSELEDFERELSQHGVKMVYQNDGTIAYLGKV